MKKWLVGALLAGGIVAFFVFGGRELLTLDALKAQSAHFAAAYTAHPLAFASAFFAVYVIATSLSFPGAAILTIAAGALFGTLTGTVLVSFASTLGATIAMLLARLLLRDVVQKRFGERLKRFDEGFAREGAFYLFALRLVPAAPFFVVNLGMGLTPIRARTFAWVSQLGMLPGTAVYVYAGTALPGLDELRNPSLTKILSPQLLLAFTLLGLFPLVVKKIVDHFKK